VTGWDYTEDELRSAGERIYTLKKLFNIREGWQPEDDWLPERLLREPLTTGSAAGVALFPTELRLVLRGYYEARKWDARGFVPDRKLAQLGIGTAANEDAHAKR
jgi:aldehyde:ferredoxin oxidoreductase